MHSEKLLDHFENPRNVGELAPPALQVEVSNPACGDVLRLSADVRDGRFAEVRFKTRGCTASIATGSALTELITGQDLRLAQAITKDEVESAVGGLSNESKHAAVLAADGLKALLKAASQGL